MIYCVSIERMQESCSKKKKMPKSWLKRGKEEGSTALEKVRAGDVGLRMLVLFLYNLNLIPKCRRFEPNILISVPKLRSFGISLKKKKKKNQYYCVSILNPKIIRYPPLSLFH